MPLIATVGRRLRSLPPIAFVLAVPALISLGLCIHQLVTPNLLVSVYDGDDGVYFGAAMRLSDGLFPYKDFVIVHPPGIAVLLLPLTVVGHLFGTRAGLASARCLTAIVTAGNVVLLGLLVRYRGLFATFSAGLLLACFPVAVAADNTLLLEPYLAFMCLIGLLLTFRGGCIALQKSRLFLGGLAFGLAGAIKIWAVFPVLAIAVYLVIRHRRALATFLAGVASGFLVVSGPFLVLAPSAFLHEVIGSQWLRTVADGTPSVSAPVRLVELTGLSGLNVTITLTVALVVAAALVLSVVSHLVTTLPRRPLEFVLAGGTAISVAADFASRDFYEHYAYFPAVFLAPLLAAGLSGLVGRFRVLASRAQNPRARWGLSRLPWLVAVAAACAVVPVNASYASQYLAASSINDPAPVIDAAIPVGRCVLTTDAAYAIVANRFTSLPGCPTIDDSYGTWITLNNGRPPASPPYSTALVAQWTTWLEQASYLIYRPMNLEIPWTPELTSWFNSNYRLVTSDAYFKVFVHVGSSTPAG